MNGMEHGPMDPDLHGYSSMSDNMESIPMRPLTMGNGQRGNGPLAGERTVRKGPFVYRE